MCCWKKKRKVKKGTENDLQASPNVPEKYKEVLKPKIVEESQRVDTTLILIQNEPAAL